MNKESTPANTLNIPMKREILKTIREHIDDMMKKHNKVFVMRIDVRAKDNAELSMFNQRLMQTEKRRGIDAGYVAVAEKSSAGEVHFHECLLLNGTKTQSTIPHIEKATQIMNQLRNLPHGQNNGLIDDCNSPKNPQRNGIMLRREDSNPTNLRNVYRQCSYLAKTDQKDGFDKGTRKVFASQLKMNKKKR